MTPSRFEDDRLCFACGKDNPDGLHLEFESVGDEVRTSVTFPGKFQGYRNVVHGGLVSTVLDETMVTLLNRLGYLALTAELSVRFREPVCVGERIDVTAGLLEKRGKVFKVEARAVRPDGTVVATAESRCFQVGLAQEEP
ncbi:MAG: PaaI family thioesterase [Candidatus Eisenbacteria bacterium]|jgi:acyl-coenzyme A thioesterase PaaI-like protein